jgi:glutamate synthase (ferredoxin)
MRFVAQDVREWMAKLGFRKLDEMIGRSDCLEVQPAVDHWKARGLDFSKILYQPDVPDSVGRYKQLEQEHGLEKSLDRRTLLALCQPAIESGEPVSATIPISNTDRVVGTILGSEVTRRYGGAGLPDDTIQLKFEGSAGQSFAAFVPRGMSMTLVGDANDYFGKGLSGGKVIVYPPAASRFRPEENIIIGNVAFYGATSGEAYILGVAGERFCVRNSGVEAVVEGVGDHGCEYMTGGKVVVLGGTGRNFAAGMSGGVAYVYDEIGDFAKRCNPEMVDLVSLDALKEIESVRGMIERHLAHTGSSRAQALLEAWDKTVTRIVKVLPRDYARMLAEIERAEQLGLSGEEAVMAAFEANMQDMARVSGN